MTGSLPARLLILLTKHPNICRNLSICLSLPCSNFPRFSSEHPELGARGRQEGDSFWLESQEHLCSRNLEGLPLPSPPILTPLSLTRNFLFHWLKIEIKEGGKIITIAILFILNKLMKMMQNAGGRVKLSGPEMSYGAAFSWMLQSPSTPFPEGSKTPSLLPQPHAVSAPSSLHRDWRDHTWTPAWSYTRCSIIDAMEELHSCCRNCRDLPPISVPP